MKKPQEGVSTDPSVAREGNEALDPAVRDVIERFNAAYDRGTRERMGKPMPPAPKDVRELKYV